MAKCEYCGRELADGEVCGCTQSENAQQIDWNKYFQLTLSKDTLANAKKVLDTIRENLSENDISQGTGGPYESNMQITNECVVPTEQEIPVRQYNIAKLRTPLWKKAYGRLQVTNKRVLFRAKGKSLAGPIEIENEFSLEEIGGVEIKMDYRFNLLLFLLSTLCILGCTGIFCGIAMWMSAFDSIVPLSLLCVVISLASVAVLALVQSKMWKAILTTCAAVGWSLLESATEFQLWEFFGVLFAIVGIVMCILSALVDDLHILLKIKGAHGAIEIGRKLRNDERSGFSVVQPWKDTGIAIRELGALIDDVKRFGNAGIEKWKV